MKIKNHELESFGKFIYGLKLKGKDSRMRTRMITLIDSHLETFNAERNLLINESAQKNEDGTLKLEEGSENNVLIIPEKIEEFYNELGLLLDEEFHIEPSESNKDMIISVANILLNCDLEVSEHEATMYDSWCIMFEDALEKYNLLDN